MKEENETMADRKRGGSPDEAVADREAQKHDLAYSDTGGEPVPGLYPSDDIEDRKGENTPDAAHPTVEWDTRIQPERVDETSQDGAIENPEIEKEGGS
jgi:hypothetical protein